MSLIACEDFDLGAPRRATTPPEVAIREGIPGFYTYDINGVDTVICPFDSSHMMKRNRLQYHLRKCYKQHIGEKVRCPFNATEYVKAEDLISHMSVCSSRERILVSQWNSTTTLTSDNNPYVSSANVPPPMERPYKIDETW